MSSLCACTNLLLEGGLMMASMEASKALLAAVSVSSSSSVGSLPVLGDMGNNDLASCARGGGATCRVESQHPHATSSMGLCVCLPPWPEVSSTPQVCRG